MGQKEKLVLVSGFNFFNVLNQWLLENPPPLPQDQPTLYEYALLFINDYTRPHAQTIIDIEIRFSQHLEQISKAIALPQFDSYNRVFDQ